MSKVMSLEDAVSFIDSGSHVTFGGFAHTLTPMAFVRELIRQGKRNLVMTGIAECWAADMLIGARSLAKLYLSNFMFEGFGRCRNFSRAVESGELPVEDYSHLALATRFAAGAMGLPFLPSRSMLGSDICQSGFPDEKKYVEMYCPFTGERLLLLPAVKPDFAIFHGHCADSNGNVQIVGAKAVIEEQMRAAKTVLVTVEKIVSTAAIRNNPDITVIPGFLVSGVVEVPFGAHPTGMYRMYDYDENHIEQYVKASRDPATFQDYLDEFVFKPSNHWDYLEQFDVTRLLELRSDPFLGYKNPE